MTLPPPYYQPEEDDERPFICSLPSDNGIMSCSDVPARREGGRTCCLDKEDAFYRQALGLSPEPLANGSAEATGLCINWNQYYTRCHTGSTNPHKGAISFDNIVYAWIVIFQVRPVLLCLSWFLVGFVVKLPSSPSRSSLWRVGWRSCITSWTLIPSTTSSTSSYSSL